MCFFIQQSKARLETKRQNHAWALYRLTGTYLKPALYQEDYRVIRRDARYLGQRVRIEDVEAQGRNVRVGGGKSYRRRKKALRIASTCT